MPVQAGHPCNSDGIFPIPAGWSKKSFEVFLFREIVATEREENEQLPVMILFTRFFLDSSLFLISGVCAFWSSNPGIRKPIDQ